MTNPPPTSFPRHSTSPRGTTPPRRKAYSLVHGLLVVGLAAIAFFVGRGFAPRQPAIGRSSGQDGGVTREANQPQSWTCSMHPQVRLDGPGNCPICEMPLIPAGGASGGPDGVPTLTLSPHAIAMASVETTPVVRRELSHEVRAVGKIEYSEWSLATITARVDGYAERLFVDFTGVAIKKGHHLVEIYSPELLVAQQELLIASQGRGTGLSLAPSRVKLRLWGLTDAQIDEMIDSKQITARITLYSPIDGTVIEKKIVQNSAFKAGDALYRIANVDTVWVYLDIYEFDLAWVRYGQEVELTAEAHPGRTFHGMVTFVQPIVNEATRTVRVPVHIENPDHALMPGMYVSAILRATLGPDGAAAPTGVEGRYSCPMHPQVLRDEAGACPICGMPLEQIPKPAAPAKPGHGAHHQSDSPRFACPMTCEGEKIYNQPGRCPVCHMMLKELTPASSAPAPGYFCPMKCEGEKTYPQPGNCPVCNMKLEEMPAAASQPGDGLLAIPVAAVLDSGTRRIVYVEKGAGTFEPREIVLGPRSGEFYPVLQGLQEGERVVARGGFLVDSQFQVTGHSSLLYPGGLHGSMGHPHEAGEARSAAGSPATTRPTNPTAAPDGHQH